MPPITDLQVSQYWAIVQGLVIGIAAFGTCAYIALREPKENPMKLGLPTPGNLHIMRGTGWLLIALLGAVLVQHGDEWFGMTPYIQTWIGAISKAAATVIIAFRISRDVLKIDPSFALNLFLTNDTKPTSVPEWSDFRETKTDPSLIAFALLHLARGIVIVGFVIAVTLSL